MYSEGNSLCFNPTCCAFPIPMPWSEERKHITSLLKFIYHHKSRGILFINNIFSLIFLFYKGLDTKDRSVNSIAHVLSEIYCEVIVVKYKSFIILVTRNNK